MSIQQQLPVDQRILTRLKDAVIFVDQDGTIIKGNRAAFSVLGLNEEKGSLYQYLDFSLLKANDESHLLMELKNQNNKPVEVQSVRMDTDVFCLIINEFPIVDKTEEVKKYINQLTINNDEGIVMYDDGVIIDCDTAFARMFGYTEEELTDMELRQLIHHLDNTNDQLDNLHELTGVRKDGSLFYVEWIEHPYNHIGDIIGVAIVKNITDRIENEKQIEYMAYYDDLTDLPNRNYFNNVLQEAVVHAASKKEMFSVYFIDLNYFKEINDTLGYDFGDELLKACGERFKSFLNTSTFIARMGGDEFIILHRHVRNRHDAVIFAKRLIAAFAKPIKVGDCEQFTSISIGISIYPDHGSTSSELIKHADSAMYVIKERDGSNYKLFDASISEKFSAMLTMENDLRTALKEGQFELYYQPQKNLYSNKIVGIEALLRWNHPVKGFVPPNEFISHAERTGLIIEIGDWVLKEACRQNKAWQDKGFPPVIVSVNLSAKQFHQRELVEKVEGILQETGLEPDYLELEITESMAMTNEPYILETLERLRRLGVKVSIDDFGTGYSSFKYLSMFPVSKLKIDKMFMNENQKQNQAIVKSIIHMSHSLNMKVIAEGVETYEQLQFLTAEKCDEMQGFFLSKPLPANAVIQLLRE
ncbi:putative bifunctional diguanylate cyclase/phosphodiesterase [Lentibacillus cibarius]|uniref:EAL domain-containing protein n=1 Tax=Lentibacillus cibarius TaxID=2583219 RepID=A0A5S3QP36_9BACI|nr:EAL domain-containing protein [Lentibacillus cibarius]TMN23418.1 EAL domain-containing protein [Lentibacillus cibarius]